MQSGNRALLRVSAAAVCAVLIQFGLSTSSAAGGAPPTPSTPAGSNGSVSTNPPCGLGCDPATQPAIDQGQPANGTVVLEPGENGTVALIIAFVLVGAVTLWGLSQFLGDRHRARAERRANPHARRTRGIR